MTTGFYFCRNLNGMDCGSMEWVEKQRGRGEEEEVMDQLTQKFVLTRMEALEAKIRNNEEYWQQVRIANRVGKNFEEACNKGEEVLKAYDKYEEELSKANCIYSEEAYKLGFEDGLMIGVEKKPDGRKSVLSLEDMTALIVVYASVQKLKETMLGGKSEYWEEGGVLATFEKVYDIIEHATCAEIRLMGEDEVFEMVTDVLGKNATPQEKAKELLGIV